MCNLSAFHAIADIYLQLRAGRNRLISRCLKRADMQERIAGSIAQLDETETLFALEPFDDRVDARPAWRRRFPGAAASGSEARSRGPARARRIIGRRPIVIETALLGSPEISTFAHDVPARLHQKIVSNIDLARFPRLVHIGTSAAISENRARQKASPAKVPAQKRADGGCSKCRKFPCRVNHNNCRPVWLLQSAWFEVARLEKT